MDDLVTQSGSHIPFDKLPVEKKRAVLQLASTFDKLVDVNMKLIIAVKTLIVTNVILCLIQTFILIKSMR